MGTGKFTVVDGLKYKEQGPYCILCGTHMGMYYCADGEPTFLNPHGYKSYQTNYCPECGAEYDYEEGYMLVLSMDDLNAIRKTRNVEIGNPRENLYGED